MTYSYLSSEKIFSKKNLSEFSFWQSNNWKNILEKSEQADEVFYFWDEQKTFAMIEKRSIGGGFYGAFILWIKNFQIANDFESFFQALIPVLKEKKCVFVQFEPLEQSEILENFFKKNTTKLWKIYKKFLTPFTRVISLHNTAEEILMKMPQKWRYAVRNAEKQGVQVQLLEKVEEKHIEAWMSLLHETTKRDNFSHNSEKYYRTFLSELEWNMIVAVANYKEKIIAMAITALTGEEWIYYYGASTSEPEWRKVAASYLLLWWSMELAREKWKKNYDLLGVADPENPDDPLAGVSQFKQKLGGELVKLPEKFLYIISSKYSVFLFLHKMSKIFKK